MFKIQKIREEDYWLYIVSFFGVFFTAVAIYASVFSFRGPAIILAVLFLWFSFHKIAEGYSLARARFHLGACIVVSILLTWLVVALTN